jgi:hypothetical protein
MIKSAGPSLPTVVMESGWSESRNRLRDDMNLWLVALIDRPTMPDRTNHRHADRVGPQQDIL